MHCQRIFSWDPHTYEQMDDMMTEMFCHCICKKSLDSGCCWCFWHCLYVLLYVTVWNTLEYMIKIQNNRSEI